MMKFFRKHNRKLLAVFMALLLVVWLGGSALTSLIGPSPEDIVLARCDYDGDILELDRRVAAFEVELLEQLGLDWTRPWPFVGPGAHEPLTIIDWILLTREAEHLGMMPRQVEVDAFLGNFGLTPDHLHRLAARRDVKAEHIYAAIGRYISVFNTLLFTVTATAESEAAVRVKARDELEKVKVNLVAINARVFELEMDEFTDEEIQAHFEKYREDSAGSGVNFGYVQPAQVKVQYFKIDTDTVAKNLRIREQTLDRRARDYWRENKVSQEFRRPEPPPEEETPADESTEEPVSEADEPLPEPEEGPESPYFETFEEAREVALDVVRKEAAEDEVRKIIGWLQKELSEPWYGLPAGDDEYPVATPELLDGGYYASLLERLPGGLRFGDAVTIGVTDLFKQDAATRVPQIGRAQATIGAATRRFRTEAFRVQGVEPLPTAPGASRADYLAVGQSSQFALSNPDGDSFVFRVLEVIPPGPPTELTDEIREQAIEDLRMLRGYERAKEAAERFAASVTGDGLQGAWNVENELQGLTNPAPGFYTPEPFPRRRAAYYQTGMTLTPQTYVSGIGSVDESVIERFFELESKPLGQRVAVIPVDERAVVAVVEWVERLPVRTDTYQAERSRIARTANDHLMAQQVSAWLDPMSIRQRTGFEPARR